MRGQNNSLPSIASSVAILVPARNESRKIESTLQSLLSQTHSDFDISVIDDRSTDTTGEIINRLAAENEKLHALHIVNLRDGWLGKPHALALAARDVTADWLLFVDSDVTCEPEALAKALALAEERNYDALSIMTRLECHNFWEKLLLPLCAASVATICTVSQTNVDSRRKIAFANGQFFLIRRSVYEAVGAHEAVKSSIVEDVALMRRIKSRGYKVRLFSGQDLASTRMHDSLPKIFSGWARILSGVTNRSPIRIILAIIFLLCSFAAYPAFIAAIAHSDHRLFIAAAAHLIIMMIVLITIYAWSGNPGRYALLFPLAVPMMLLIYANAIGACLTGEIAWRGSRISFKPVSN
jgi:cellulose synthase/poly-beta-1,6-N-acetylglucosamine synthase-like glycosyltransferase